MALENLTNQYALNNSKLQTRLRAETFESSKYDIQSTQYPSDLYSNTREYGGNYVLFYINIVEDSKLLPKQGGSVSVLNDQVSNRLRGDLVGLNLSKTQSAGAAAGVGFVTGLFGGGVANIGALKTAIKGGAIGAVYGTAVTGAIPLTESGATKARSQQKRTRHAIALHIPNQLNITYGVDWQTDETFAFQAAAVAATGATDVAKAIQTGAKKNSDKTDQAETSQLGSIAQAIALRTAPGVGGALSAATGNAANPKKEQIFKSVNYREFTLDYTFSPKDAEEAQAVRNIIYLFKLHMHPEYKDENGFIFVYPSEFDITYYQGGAENLNLHRHPSCVLKNMSINYTPNGAFNTFDDGMPTQINVQLQFLELAILTKETIQANY
jgi:hypothetical protein